MQRTADEGPIGTGAASADGDDEGHQTDEGAQHETRCGVPEWTDKQTKVQSLRMINRPFNMYERDAPRRREQQFAG